MIDYTTAPTLKGANSPRRLYKISTNFSVSLATPNVMIDKIASGSRTFDDRFDLMDFTDLTPADIDRLVELNGAAYPAVPITDSAEMGALLAGAGFTIAARDDSGLIGFVIGMMPGAEYSSENYRWFDARGTDFLYVDRIVIDESQRGKGIGRMLYAKVFELAGAEGRTEVTCEVNVEPPNPESLAFHARLGFSRIGEQETKNGSVTVALLAAALPTS